MREKFRDILAERFLEGLCRSRLAPGVEDALIDSFLRRQSDPYTAAEEILRTLSAENSLKRNLHPEGSPLSKGL